ncbi:MAG: glycosyltransferase family 2 protein [Actinomycetaceae bacterium]|nr:glycosyltransferase family 2 protein [Actinomycetaceae bacterium]
MSPSPQQRRTVKASLLVIIPAFNEAESLPALLQEMQQCETVDADVLVVDDASADTTSDIARAAGVGVLSLPINLGVGGAMRTGYCYAVERGYEYAVQVDADGQHRPEDIPRLVHCMEDTGADIVVGSRFAGVGTYRVRGPRAWAMKLLSSVLSRQCGTRLTDTTSGFKLVNRRTCQYFAHNMPTEYLGDTIEALVLAAKADLHIEEVGVEMRQRIAGNPSHGAWKSTVFLARACVSLVLAMSRPKMKLHNTSDMLAEN